MKTKIAIALVLGLGACHAHQVESGHRSMSSPPQDQIPKQKEVRSPRPVRTTPGGFLDDKSMREIQHALAAKGERVQMTGKLDETTRAALRSFQAKSKQPPTGFPDYDTVQRLGLDARQLYLGGASRQPVDKSSTQAQ